MSNTSAAASILSSARAGAAELRGKSMPRAAEALRKLGAGVNAIGGAVESTWADDFSRMMRSSSGGGGKGRKKGKAKGAKKAKKAKGRKKGKKKSKAYWRKFWKKAKAKGKRRKGKKK